jgi:hypothetical protein
LEMSMKRWVRVGAGVTLCGLCYWLASTGWWEIAGLVAIGAGLGAVVARPPKPPRYAPTYWVKKETGL